MAVTDVRRYRFSVEEYARMGEAGIFAEDDRVELIGGEIREMTPIAPLHAGVVNRLTELIVTRLAGRANVAVQNPMRLDRYSEPQPDVVVARRQSGSYTDRHPEPADVLLVIEVADSSLQYDRAEKVPRYGRAGIPETWVVDLAARAVTAYTGPGAAGYAREQVLAGDDTLAATAVAGLRVPVSDVFGA